MGGGKFLKITKYNINKTYLLKNLYFCNVFNSNIKKYEHRKHNSRRSKNKFK